jgi:hypothetical protein
MVVLKKIAVNSILIDKIIVLVFLTLLEAIMVFDFRELLNYVQQTHNEWM